MFFFIGEYSGVDLIIVSIAYMLVIVLSLSLHEFAHAFVAYKCGDVTPKMQGRVTINPLKHFDTVGFICCIFLGYGWAKPVQINQMNFRDIKKGQGLTSVAGVIMNLILSFVGYGLYKVVCLFAITNIFLLFLEMFFFYLYWINVCLAVFNFLPIYPLDGFRFVENYSSYNNGYVNFMYKYGYLVLIAVLFIFDGLLMRLISYVSFPITILWDLVF